MTYKFSEKVSHLQASAIREILKFTSDPEVISFAAGNPSPEAFPVDELNRISEEILRKILSAHSSTALQRDTLL